MSKSRSRRRRPVPSMILWSRAEQRRFIDAVEKLCSLVHELDDLVRAKKRRARPKPDLVVDEKGTVP